MGRKTAGRHVELHFSDEFDVNDINDDDDDDDEDDDDDVNDEGDDDINDDDDVNDVLKRRSLLKKAPLAVGSEVCPQD